MLAMVAAPLDEHLVRYLTRVAERCWMIFEDVDVTLAGTPVGSHLIRAGAAPMVRRNAISHDALTLAVVRNLLERVRCHARQIIVVERLPRAQWRGRHAAEQEGRNYARQHPPSELGSSARMGTVTALPLQLLLSDREPCSRHVTLRCW